MDLAELRRDLEESGFSPADYRVDDKPAENTLCLERRRRIWLVYYYEHGQKYDLRRFKAESEACEYFLRRIRGLDK